MLQISEELARRFQKTYEQKFGESISTEEAKQTLSDLAELVKMLIKERSFSYGK